jgi:hypothetical protein
VRKAAAQKKTLFMGGVSSNRRQSSDARTQMREFCCA